MQGSANSWIDVDRDLAIHNRCIEQASTCFIDRSTVVAPSVATPDEIRILGQLLCQGGLLIHVDEQLERDQRNRVREVACTYQAQFAEPPLRQISRYDNAHVHRGTAHPDPFHKHVFDDRTWRETEVEHIGRERFPTLLEVIDELYARWLRHCTC